MDEETREVGALTDGFHLVIDALKLNDINTIYNVPGIPITDLGRYMQAAGMRVLSFRHEQNAGYAAAIAGFLTKKPGICLTVSAPGFLNGLTALAHATTNCFPMILISGSSEREIVDLQQGDYEEMDQLAIAKPLCKAAYRVLHAEHIGIGIARAIRAAVPGSFSSQGGDGHAFQGTGGWRKTHVDHGVGGRQFQRRVADAAQPELNARGSVECEAARRIGDRPLDAAEDLYGDAGDRCPAVSVTNGAVDTGEWQQPREDVPHEDLRKRR